MKTAWHVRSEFHCSVPGCEFSFTYGDMQEFIESIDAHYEAAHDPLTRLDRAELSELPLTPGDIKFLQSLRVSPS